MASKHYAECDVCKEQLGDYKPYYAKEHLKMHPDHRELFYASKKFYSSGY